MTDEKKPTAAQIKYAYDLIDKLGYAREDYNFGKMTRQQAIRLIAKLKREKEEANANVECAANGGN